MIAGGVRLLEGSPFEGALRPTDHELVWESIQVLPPCRPSKIVGIGSNYRLHCEEMGRPVPEVPKLFLKAPSALLPHGGVIQLPDGVGRVDFEGELAVVIGRLTRRVRAEAALDHILGYSVLNDVTARDLQKRDVVFARAKGFDTFCPLGPVIETALDPDDLGIQTAVGGAIRQDGRTSDMVFSVRELVAFVSSVMTLMPGDVIATGTPSGVGPLAPGDVVSVTVEGIGTLENPVEDATP